MPDLSAESSLRNQGAAVLSGGVFAGLIFAARVPLLLLGPSPSKAKEYRRRRQV